MTNIRPQKRRIRQVPTAVFVFALLCQIVLPFGPVWAALSGDQPQSVVLCTPGGTVTQILPGNAETPAPLSQASGACDYCQTCKTFSGSFDAMVSSSVEMEAPTLSSIGLRYVLSTELRSHPALRANTTRGPPAFI